MLNDPDAVKSRANFSLVISEISISTLATSIFTVLILWMAISYTSSPLVTGVTAGLMTAPMLASAVIGAYVDRSGRKRTPAVAGTLMKAVSPLLLLPIYLGGYSYQSVISLFASALLFGFSIDLLIPVRAIWGQRFLPERKYVKGWSTAGVATKASRLAGYLASGILVASSVANAVLVVFLLYAVSLVPILLMPRISGMSEPPGLGTIMADGLNYVRRTRVVLSVVAISAFSALFLGMTDSVSTVMINSVFFLGPAFLSFTFFAISSGGMIGSFYMAARKEVNDVREKLAFYFLAEGLVLVVAWALPGFSTLLIVFFVLGIFSGLVSPLTTALLFRYTEKEKMGTVQGIFDTFGTSFNSIAGVLAGAIMSVSFPGTAFLIMAAGLIVLSVAIMQSRSLASASV